MSGLRSKPVVIGTGLFVIAAAMVATRLSITTPKTVLARAVVETVLPSQTQQAIIRSVKTGPLRSRVTGDVRFVVLVPGLRLQPDMIMAEIDRTAAAEQFQNALNSLAYERLQRDHQGLEAPGTSKRSSSQEILVELGKALKQQEEVRGRLSAMVSDVQNSVASLDATLVQFTNDSRQRQSALELAIERADTLVRQRRDALTMTIQGNQSTLGTTLNNLAALLGQETYRVSTSDVVELRKRYEITSRAVSQALAVINALGNDPTPEKIDQASIIMGNALAGLADILERASRVIGQTPNDPSMRDQYMRDDQLGFLVTDQARVGTASTTLELSQSQYLQAQGQMSAALKDQEGYKRQSSERVRDLTAERKTLLDNFRETLQKSLGDYDQQFIHELRLRDALADSVAQERLRSHSLTRDSSSNEQSILNAGDRAQQLEQEYRQHLLRADDSSVVDTVAVGRGQHIDIGEALATVRSSNFVDFQLSVGSNLWPVGQRLEASSPAFGNGIHLAVTVQALNLDQHTMTIMLEDQTYRGMFTDGVVVQVRPMNTVLSPSVFIPEQALRGTEAQRWISIIDSSGKVISQNVRTGIKRGNAVEITEGLRGGESILYTIQE